MHGAEPDARADAVDRDSTASGARTRMRCVVRARGARWRARTVGGAMRGRRARTARAEATRAAGADGRLTMNGVVDANES